MRFLVGLIFGVVGGIAAMHLLAQDERPQHRLDALGHSRVEASIIGESIGDGKIVRLSYADGRVVLIRNEAISAVWFIPDEWAEAVGYDDPFIELQIGSRTHRVDLPDEQSAKNVYEELVGGDELGPLFDD